MAKGLIWATTEDLAKTRPVVLSVYRQILRSLNSSELPLTYAARLAKKAEVRTMFLFGSEERSLHNIADLIDAAKHSLIYAEYIISNGCKVPSVTVLYGLLRCGKSCRLRWINYLRPDIKRGNFTKEEEDTVIRLHKLLGNKWSKIASCLPGRTDNEIKNVWNTHLKKKLEKMDVNETKNKPGETQKPSSSTITDYVSDSQMSKSEAEQSDDHSSKYTTDSSTEKNDNPTGPISDLTSVPPLIEPNMAIKNSIWEMNMDTIPMILSPNCSSSSEVIQTLEIPEFTMEPEIWDMLEHLSSGTGDQSCNIDQDVLNPETERELNKRGDWLEKLERELGLWETIEEPQGVMGPLHGVEGDPISTYFEN